MESGGIISGAVRPGGGLFAGSGRAGFGQSAGCPLSMKWSALHEAAETVALIAGTTGGAMSADARKFPAAMREASPTLRRRAEQGVADITAILEPGLSALLATHARGSNPAPAATALWQEFLAARDQVMSLAPQNVPQAPRFSV